LTSTATGAVIVSTFTGYIAKMTSTFTGISYINTGTNNATSCRSSRVHRAVAGAS